MPPVTPLVPSLDLPVVLLSHRGPVSFGRDPVSGEIPSPMNPPPGCPFEPRCFHPMKDARCRSERPALRRVAEQEVACHYAEVIAPEARPLEMA